MRPVVNLLSLGLCLIAAARSSEIITVVSAPLQIGGSVLTGDFNGSVQGGELEGIFRKLDGTFALPTFTRISGVFTAFPNVYNLLPGLQYPLGWDELDVFGGLVKIGPGSSHALMAYAALYNNAPHLVLWEDASRVDGVTYQTSGDWVIRASIAEQNTAVPEPSVLLTLGFVALMFIIGSRKSVCH